MYMNQVPHNVRMHSQFCSSHSPKLAAHFLYTLRKLPLTGCGIGMEGTPLVHLLGNGLCRAAKDTQVIAAELNTAGEMFSYRPPQARTRLCSLVTRTAASQNQKKNMCVYISININVNIHRHAYLRVCAHVCMYVCAYVYLYMYIHVYIHTEKLLLVKNL